MTSHDDLIKRSLRLLTYHRKRIWWITSRVVVLTFILTAFGLAFRPKYVARTKITILPTRSEIGFAAQRPEMLVSSPATMLGQTFAEGLASRTLAEDVAKALLADNSPELNNGGMLGHARRIVIAPILGFIGQTMTLLNTGRWTPPDPFMSLVYGIQGRTTVQNVPGSFVFQIAVTWENPKIAAAIANLLADRQVQMTLQVNREEMKATREYIEARIAETKGEVAAVEGKIRDYRVNEKLYASATDLTLGLQEQSQYQRDLNATRVNRAQLDARIDALKSYQTPSSLAAIEAERAELRTREAAVEKVIDEQMGKLDKMPQKEAVLVDLYRTRMGLERGLVALQDRLLDTLVAEAGQLSTARVIDKAIPPVYPEGPLMLRSLIGSLFVGLLLSVGCVMAMEAWRPGLRSREDLGVEGDNVVGLVPYVVQNGNGHSDPDTEKEGGIMAFMGSLLHGRHGTIAHRRVAKRHLEDLLLRLTDGSARARICMFVSLNGGEGKTYLIEHLAKLGREAGLKVLLIDANMSDHSLSSKFGKPSTPGLAEMLSGAAEAGKVLVSVDTIGDLIGAGVKRLNSQGKWAVEAVRLELNRLAEGYDLVLIDTAALRRDPSATRLLPLATDVWCVLDAIKSYGSEASDLRQRLSGTTAPVRFILNKKLHAGDHLFAAGANGNGHHHEKPLASAIPARRNV